MTCQKQIMGISKNNCNGKQRLPLMMLDFYNKKLFRLFAANQLFIDVINVFNTIILNLLDSQLTNKNPLCEKIVEFLSKIDGNHKRNFCNELIISATFDCLFQLFFHQVELCLTLRIIPQIQTGGASILGRRCCLTS